MGLGIGFAMPEVIICNLYEAYIQLGIPLHYQAARAVGHALDERPTFLEPVHNYCREVCKSGQAVSQASPNRNCRRIHRRLLPKDARRWHHYLGHKCCLARQH